MKQKPSSFTWPFQRSEKSGIGFKSAWEESWSDSFQPGKNVWVFGFIKKRRRRLKQKPKRIRMLICSSICPIIQSFSTFLNDQNFKSQIMLICYSQMNLIPILNHLWNIQQCISGVNEPITKRPPWIIIIWVKNRLWS